MALSKTITTRLEEPSCLKCLCTLTHKQYPSLEKSELNKLEEGPHTYRRYYVGVMVRCSKLLAM